MGNVPFLSHGALTVHITCGSCGSIIPTTLPEGSKEFTKIQWFVPKSELGQN